MFKHQKFTSIIFLVPPQLETVEPQTITKREGEPLTLLCLVQSENLDSEARKESELRITWAKDGRPMESSLSPNYEVFFLIIFLFYKYIIYRFWIKGDV